MAYAEDEPEPEEARNKMVTPWGSNLAEIPCFRHGRDVWCHLEEHLLRNPLGPVGLLWL